MKQKIKNYQLYLFGHVGEHDFIDLSQEEGQKIMIAVANNILPKFIIINGQLINTSAIERICEFGQLGYNPEVRELTESEIRIQEKFLQLTKSEKILLNKLD